MAIIALATDKYYPDVNPPNIIVPYTDAKNPAFAAAKLNFECLALRPRYVDMNAELDAPYAYHRLIHSLWAEGKPFILVEHDILPWPGALEQLWECECAWGAFRYHVLGNLAAYLGCVKFDPLKLGPCPLPEEPMPWTKLDLHIVKTLTSRGERGHVHNPPVCHLNRGHQRMTRSIVCFAGG